LVEKTEGEQSLRRLGHRCKDIKIDLTKTVFGGAEWIHFAQNRDHWQGLANTVMNL
jgi:hypothetical protein